MLVDAFLRVREEALAIQEELKDTGPVQQVVSPG